jgi:hypothetical protein
LFTNIIGAAIPASSQLFMDVNTPLTKQTLISSAVLASIGFTNFCTKKQFEDIKVGYKYFNLINMAASEINTIPSILNYAKVENCTENYYENYSCDITFDSYALGTKFGEIVAIGMVGIFDAFIPPVIAGAINDYLYPLESNT